MYLDQVMESISSDLDFWDATRPSDRHPLTGALRLRRYADIKKALTDAKAYSLQMEVVSRIQEGYWTQDNPQHDQLQKVIAPEFRLKAIEDRVVPIIDEEVASSIRDITESGARGFEFGLLGRIPRRVIARYMGMDPGEDAGVKQWIADVNLGRQTPEQEQAVYDEFAALLQERKRDFPEGVKPRNPVDALVYAQRAGHPILGEVLSDRWAEAQLGMLRVAGDETTATVLGNILQAFSVHGVFTELRAQSGLLPAALEEGYRCYPPFGDLGFPGKANMDIEVGEGSHTQTVQAGEFVDASVARANFDPAVFEQPFRFDIRRSPNPHLTFAVGGWRRCTGDHLARQIIQRTVAAVINYLPGVEWDGVPFQRTKGLFLTVIPDGALHFTFDVDRARELVSARTVMSPTA